jgi:hydroxymethylglutaryl-CoA synthase
MIGLAAVLDVAKPGERILVTSYGSGAGSDSFVITVTNHIDAKRPAKKRQVLEMIKNKHYIDYALYAKHRRKIKSMD